MEKIFEQGLLYDFYGELLTSHQRSVYEDAVYNDLSLGEIAQEYGISRQGVHDLIRRCDKSLQEYESKLQLVAKFMQAKEKIGRIVALTQIEEADQGSEGALLTPEGMKERMDCIRQLAQDLMKEW